MPLLACPVCPVNLAARVDHLGTDDFHIRQRIGRRAAAQLSLPGKSLIRAATHWGNYLPSRGLTKDYGDIQAVKGIDFELLPTAAMLALSAVLWLRIDPRRSPELSFRGCVMFAPVLSLRQERSELMTNRTVRAPRSKSLGNSLDRRLLRYAAVAGTAIAASQNSLEASVILRNLNIDIIPAGPYVDVNLDGIDDFRSSPGVAGEVLFGANPIGISALNRVASVNSVAGVGINAGTSFVATRTYLDNFCGPAAPALPFLGFRLHLNDGDHYGYFKVSGSNGAEVDTLVSVAYETQAGVSILTDAPASTTPEPGSLALLALGAAGLAALRRKWAKA